MFPVQSANPKMEDTWPLRAWSMNMAQAILNDGIDPDPAPKFCSIMEDIGFVNVKEQPLQWPVGAWPKGDREKLIGRIMVDNCLQVCRPGAMGLFTKRLGWSIDQVQEFLPSVERDIMDPKRCYYLQM
jgi:hypothetical protein